MALNIYFRVSQEKIAYIYMYIMLIFLGKFSETLKLNEAMLEMKTLNNCDECKTLATCYYDLYLINIGENPECITIVLSS